MRYTHTHTHRQKYTLIVTSFRCGEEKEEDNERILQQSTHSLGVEDKPNL